MTEKVQEQIKSTARNSAIYSLGNLLRQVTAFIMLPIYTRYLTPADYGTVALLTMAIEFAGILVAMRITQAMFRYYVLAENETEQKQIVSTVLFAVLIGTSLGVLLLVLLSQPLSSLIFGSADYADELALYAFVLMTNAVTAVGLAYLRAQRKAVFFVTIGAITLVLQLLANILFVIVLELHVQGVIYSALTSGVIMAAYLFYYVFRQVGYRPTAKVLKTLYAFIAPLILASLGGFYVYYADKYLLRVYGGLAEVGLYVLALRLTSLMEFVTTAFSMSWEADRFDAYKKDNAREIFSRIFRLYVCLILLAGAGIAIFASDFFAIMSASAFHEAGKVVPLTVAAALIVALTRFCNFGIHLKEKTRHIAEAAWIKAVLTTLLCISLIPWLGVFGAALALVVSNLVEFIWIDKKARQLYDMQLDWKPVFWMALVCSGAVLLGELLPFGEVAYIVVRLVLYVFLILAIYHLPIWSQEERAMLKNMLAQVNRLKRS